VCCSVLQCVAVCCSVLQCCSASQHVARHSRWDLNDEFCNSFRRCEWHGVCYVFEFLCCSVRCNVRWSVHCNVRCSGLRYPPDEPPTLNFATVSDIESLRRWVAKFNVEGTHRFESRHTGEWVMEHIGMSHVTVVLDVATHCNTLQHIHTHVHIYIYTWAVYPGNRYMRLRGLLPFQMLRILDVAGHHDTLQYIYAYAHISRWAVCS